MLLYIKKCYSFLCQFLDYYLMVGVEQITKPCLEVKTL